MFQSPFRCGGSPPITLYASIGPDFRTHIACRNVSLERAEFLRTLSPLLYCKFITDLLVAYGWYQWPILVSDGNHDHHWTIGRKSGAESFLDLLLRSGQNARAAEPPRGGYDVQAGKVEPGDIRSILQKFDARVPGATAIDLRAVYQRRVLALANSFGKQRDALRIWRIARTDRSHNGIAMRRPIPIIERNGDVHGPRLRCQCDRIGPHDRGRNVLRPDWLVGPFHPRTRKRRLITIREIRLAKNHLPRLLTGRNDQWRFILIGGHDVAHSISSSGRRM